MKHLITIILILLLFTSCGDKTKQRIEGDWLGFERTFILDNDTMFDNFHLILSIDKDSIKAINFKFITHGIRDSLSKSSYILPDSNLIVARNSESQDTFAIEVLNETTLILSNSKSKYKYSKLTKPSTKSKNIDLEEKIFTISDSVQVFDTIEFLGNKRLLMYNLYSEEIVVLEWRLREYLGNKFLIIDNRAIPVFFIEPIEGQNYKLKSEPNKEPKYILQNIEKEIGYKQTDLIGEWTGKSNKPDNKITFIFDYDSVQMNEFTGGEMVTATYSLNLSGTKIFCLHKYSSGYIFYEIDKIRNDSMYLERLSPIKDSFVLIKVK